MSAKSNRERIADAMITLVQHGMVAMHHRGSADLSKIIVHLLVVEVKGENSCGYSEATTGVRGLIEANPHLLASALREAYEGFDKPATCCAPFMPDVRPNPALFCPILWRRNPGVGYRMGEPCPLLVTDEDCVGTAGGVP